MPPKKRTILRKKKKLNVSEDNPPRATITEKKRGNRYRDPKNAASLRKFHKCANEPHSSGCSKKKRTTHEKEGKKTITKTHGGDERDQSGKFTEIKAKWKKRKTSIGGKQVKPETVEGIRKALAKDVDDLRMLGVDEGKLITNFFSKKKAEIKQILNSL
jgi:hypothetical protein